MDYTIKNKSAESISSPCIVVGVFERRRLTPAAAQLDEASGGAVTAALKRGDTEAKPGQTRLLTGLDTVKAPRVLLVGLGKESELDERNYRKAVAAAAQAVQDCAAGEAAFYLHEVKVKARDLAWRVQQLAIGVVGTLYRFDELKSEAETPKKPLKKLTLGVTDKDETKAAETALAQGMAVGQGMSLARDLGNRPGNVCTPTYLADQAKALGKRHDKLKVQSLDRKEMKKLAMGALLAVARGSQEEPRLIAMEWHGGKKDEQPYVLVGKGITFDTGGISLKPGAGMDEMKFDMCGAASVFGTLQAVAEMNLPINVVGVVPASDNMPDGKAVRPGDIVKTMSGQTVEILNTDAEGRLVLCDALTWSEQFKPQEIVDIATLTGACIIGLGHHRSAVLGNHPPLVQALREAGETSGDPCWELPLDPEYDEQLKSNFADMANIGGRPAGTITAASFLARFTKAYQWAHLDIAGTAWLSGDQKGATGRPVPLLTRYLMDRAGV